MYTLKEIRQKAGLTQSVLAERLKTNIPTISNYENGIDLPNLEDIVVLEKEFSTKIDWQEDYTPKRKHQIIQALIELCERYPIPAVMEFAGRMYRRNQAPDSMILHYADATNRREPEPMYYETGFKRCDKCEE